jgi:MFS family permease
LGGLLGAFVGGLLVRQYGGLTQAVMMTGLGLVILVAMRPFLLSSQVDKGLSASHFGWPTRASLVLGLLCFLALMAEGAVIDWSAIYLQQRFLLDAGSAALGYALFSGGMAFSRFAGDYLRAKAGSVKLVRWSAVMMALGMAGALLSNHPWLAIAVLVFTGIGIGNIAPVLFAGGGKLEPHAPARGIAAVVSLGYAGFLFGPPLIGITAEWTGLQLALWLIVLAGLAIAWGSRAVAKLDQE